MVGTWKGTRGDAISYEYEEGPTAPVLFLNGLTQDKNSWALCGRALKEKHGILRLDFLGQGQSDNPPPGYTMKDHAEDVCGVLESLSLSKVMLVGFSFGGHVSLELMRMAPSLFERVALVGVAHRRLLDAKLVIDAWYDLVKKGDYKNWFRVSAGVIYGQGFLRAHEKLFDGMARKLQQANPPEKILPLIHAVASLTDYRESLLAWRGKPLCFIRGNEDHLVPQSLHEEMRTLVDHSAQFHSIADSGHVIAIEQPEAFLRVLQPFLSLEAPGE